MLSKVAYQSHLYNTQKNVKSINTDTKILDQLICFYLFMGFIKVPNQWLDWETFSGYTGFYLYLGIKDMKLLQPSKFVLALGSC